MSMLITSKSRHISNYCEARYPDKPGRKRRYSSDEEYDTKTNMSIKSVKTETGLTPKTEINIGTKINTNTNPEQWQISLNSLNPIQGPSQGGFPVRFDGTFTAGKCCVIWNEEFLTTYTLDPSKVTFWGKLCDTDLCLDNLCHGTKRHTKSNSSSMGYRHTCTQE